MFPDVFWLKPWCVGRCYAVYYAVGRSTFAMDRSLSALFPPAFCPDWFQFDEYDYCYVPHQGLASSLVCCLYRRPTAEELVTNPHRAYWNSFCNTRSFRREWNRVPWFAYYAHRWSLVPGQSGFAVDDVYRGKDFVMVQLVYSQCRSMRFPWMAYRWMVVWIHHGDQRCSRYGQLLRRPTLANFRATSRANSQRQPWLSNVLHLAVP